MDILKEQQSQTGTPGQTYADPRMYYSLSWVIRDLKVSPRDFPSLKKRSNRFQNNYNGTEPARTPHHGISRFSPSPGPDGPDTEQV